MGHSSSREETQEDSEGTQGSGGSSGWLRDSPGDKSSSDLFMQQYRRPAAEPGESRSPVQKPSQPVFRQGEWVPVLRGDPGWLDDALFPSCSNNGCTSTF